MFVALHTSACSPTPSLALLLTDLGSAPSPSRSHTTHTSRSPPMLLPLLHACYTRTTCSALLPCTDCTLAQPLPLPTANSPTCLTLYYYLYDGGSTISLLAADAATAAARALSKLHYHRLCMLPRQANTPALPTQRLNQLKDFVPCRT